MTERKKPTAKQFVFGVIKDNYEVHLTPLVISFVLPFIAWVTGVLDPLHIIACGWILATAWSSMLYRDMAESFRQHIFAQEHAMGELLAERFQNAIAKKLESVDLNSNETIHMELKVDEENNVTIE